MEGYDRRGENSGDAEDAGRQEMKPEAQFEKDLAYYAPLSGCAYFKIPDPKCINAKTRRYHHEDKRPFDGVLVTPQGNYCVECKINSGKLLAHQDKNQRTINTINDSFIVLRKRIRKSSVMYQVYYYDSLEKEFETIPEMLSWLALSYA